MNSIDRRSVLKGAAFAMTAGATSRVVAAPQSRMGDPVIARADMALVDIESGRIAGYVSNGVFTFKGVP